ncbi:MAG: 2-succinyl-5-enolpyruvyl-6-hydroxy-3-cyclohexene-1-carboxylic-acid synthase [Candidatus Zixiibacteriota bacterium]
MPFEAASLNALWAELIVEELARNGLDYFCLAPGSRNTPLTVAVAQNKRTRSIVHYDERGVAFHALGWARATRRPSVVICTSGTAVANCLPAVVEAAMDIVPLIVLTADRPTELRNTGANQTIDQVKIYGDYVRWFCDLPCPTDEIDPEVLLTTVDQAVYRATRSPAGPVHINCMFREPLTPVGHEEDFTYYKLPIDDWYNESNPYTEYQSSEMVIEDEIIEEIADICNTDDEGILVVGRLRSPNETEAVKKILTRLNWPVFADIGSGMRLGFSAQNAIPYFDLVLISEKFVDEHKTFSVMQIGGRPTSKRLQEYLAQSSPGNYILIDNHPYRCDPIHRVTLRLETNVESFCSKLFTHLNKAKSSKWLEEVTSRSETIARVLQEMIDSDSRLTEPAVARLISQHINHDAGLFLASSMPIRDMDMYADPHGPDVTVGCNRGASGIDGTIAAATGFTQGLNKPVTLLIGDLAFLHDMNSLALIKSLKQPLIIVVINNDGGGVFSFLPIAQQKKIFEPYFGTPHGLHFDKVAEMFGLEYYCPSSKESFISSYESLQKKKRSAIIEVKSDRKENYKIHQEIEKRIIFELDNI